MPNGPLVGRQEALDSAGGDLQADQAVDALTP
jgi:hypothetical protein